LWWVVFPGQKYLDWALICADYQGIAPTLIIVRVGLGVKTPAMESTLKMADVMASDVSRSRFSQPDLEKGLPGTPRDVEKGFSNYDADRSV
jgi:hypothetical protein